MQTDGQIINKVCFKLWGCMKGLQPLHMKSAAATCAVRGAAASRFLYHFLAVRAAYKKMMFYPLQVCVSRLAATDRQQYFVDGLRPQRIFTAISLIPGYSGGGDALSADATCGRIRCCEWAGFVVLLIRLR